MKRYKALLAAILATASMGTHAILAQDVVLQIGSAAPINSPWDLGLKKIASEWSKISGGKVKLVFPKSVSSSSQEDMIQKLKFSIDGALLDTTGLGFIDNDIYMMSMPSVILDDAEFDKAMAAAIPLIHQKLGDRFEIVAMSKGGWIRFFSNSEIRTPEDLKKVRMGVNRNADSLAKLLQSIGVRTVKTDQASTLLQFNSGSLDAMYSSPLYVAALWSQYKRVITHMTPFRVAPFFGAIVVNKKAWERVPDSLKPALLAAADRIATEIGTEAVRLEEEGITAMKKGGLIVPAFNDADSKAWDSLYAEKMQPAIKSWYSQDFTSAIYSALGK